MFSILSQLAACKRALSGPLLKINTSFLIVVADVFFFLKHRWFLPETQAARPRSTAAQDALEAPPPEQQSRELLSVVRSPSSLMEPASI